MTIIATIQKDFTFSASHQLAELPEDHPCSRLHGHNYVARLGIQGTTDHVGFVIDYRRLGWFKELLDDTFDHRHLNDVLPGLNPTAEHLAAYLLEAAVEELSEHPNVRAIEVAVSETPKTWASVMHVVGRPR